MNILSAREQSVVDLFRAGLSDALIAKRLRLSPNTVGAHLSNVRHKLGVKDRVALALKVGGLK